MFIIGAIKAVSISSPWCTGYNKALRYLFQSHFLHLIVSVFWLESLIREKEYMIILEDVEKKHLYLK